MRKTTAARRKSGRAGAASSSATASAASSTLPGTHSVSLFRTALIVRLASVVLVSTAFNPDEYWQSVEVAHHSVFGYGHLTWEWTYALRSYLYPGVFDVVFRLLRVLHLDTPRLVVLAPRLLHAAAAAFGDVFAWRLAMRWGGPIVASWTFALQVSSWFFWFAMTRTLSNAAVTVLTLIALYHWPWPSLPPLPSNRAPLPTWFTHRVEALTLAAVSFVVRPPIALLWLFLGLHLLASLPSMRQRVRLLLEVVAVATVVLTATSLLDTVYFGRPVCTPWEFFRFNVLNNVGALYGSYSWHWYLTQGWPVVLGAVFPLWLLNILSPRYPLDVAASAVLAWTLVLSCLEHKEFRFLMPVMPLAFMQVAHTLARMTDGAPAFALPPAMLTEPKHAARTAARLGLSGARSGKRRNATASGALLVLVLCNALPGLYMGLAHQHAPVAVMRSLAVSAHTTDDVKAIHFWTPCHATPYYAHLHLPVPMRFWDCSPNLDAPAGFLDESDRFRADPLGMLSREYPDGHGLPSHAVMFAGAAEEAAPFLTANDFRLCKDVFNMHFGDPGERRMQIWCRTPPPSIT